MRGNTYGIEPCMRANGCIVCTSRRFSLFTFPLSSPGSLPIHLFYPLTKPFHQGNLHAQHHRLYVPYAFGAFYNTLSEAFIIDTVGTTISIFLSGLNTRQATIFSTISVLKGVDDHCGYKLPWDPLQWLGEQGTEFHDIHHQSWGANVSWEIAERIVTHMFMQTNYSQLYTTFWDHFFGTVCLKSEKEKDELYRKGTQDAEAKVKRLKFNRKRGFVRSIEAQC